MEPDPVVPHRHRARMVYFLVIFPAILLSGNLLVCATWNYLWPTPAAPVWMTALSLLTLAFCVTSILSMRFSNALLRKTYHISAIWLGILNYGLFAAVGALVFSAVAAFLPVHIDARWIAAVFFGAGLLTSLYGFANAACLRVTDTTVKLNNLPAAWHGRHVALVTDAHLGNIRRACFSRRIVERLQDLPCEIILIGGDLFDGPKADLDALLEPWKAISASKQVYYVTGNHEEYTGRTKYLEAVQRAGIRILNNEKVEIEGLQIMGVHDREAHAPKAYRALLQRAALDRNRASILLLHQPVHMPVTAAEGISLQLSGHTHSGQFWPWVYVARRVHRQFVNGLSRLDNLQIYTSYGAGTWGAPMRVGTKSEIVLLRLETAAPQECL